MADITPLEERQIRDYVHSQTPPESGDEVTVVQKVGRRRVARKNYDLYDVWMSSGKRWWVITNMTNLYPQDDFKSLNQTFTYHLGLNAVLREQFAVQPDEEQVETIELFRSCPDRVAAAGWSRDVRSSLSVAIVPTLARSKELRGHLSCHPRCAIRPGFLAGEPDRHPKG